MFRSLASALVCAGVLGMEVSVAHGAIVINEIVGNTPGSDYEFIELYNNGSTSVNIGGYAVYLYESDGGSTAGTDGSSPYFVPPGTILAPGGFFTFGNSTAATTFNKTFDASLPANAIENGSYTAILKNGFAGQRLFSVFVTDGGPLDAANDDATFITPDFTVGPDGSSIPAGFYLTPDGGNAIVMIDFDNILAEATPGAANIPEPGALGAAWVVGAMAVARRRRVV